MSSSTSLPEGVEFRPLMRGDVPAVLQIIREHDEDDFDFAKASYQRDIQGHYVLAIQGIVFGVTGGRYIEETDRTFALSWTYLHPEHRGQGLGKLMVEQILEVLLSKGPARCSPTRATMSTRSASSVQGCARALSGGRL